MAGRQNEREAERQILRDSSFGQPSTPAGVPGDPLKEHAAELRVLLYEAEKHCQFLSSAVSSSDLPAGTWIFVDAARMTVLAAMRCAHLLQLEIERRAPPSAAAPQE